MSQASLAYVSTGSFLRRFFTTLFAVIVLSAVAYGAWRVLKGPNSLTPPSADPQADEHAHDHGAPANLDSLELSEQARANIGLKTAKVSLR